MPVSLWGHVLNYMAYIPDLTPRHRRTADKGQETVEDGYDSSEVKHECCDIHKGSSSFGRNESKHPLFF